MTNLDFEQEFSLTHPFKLKDFENNEIHSNIKSKYDTHFWMILWKSPDTENEYNS